MYCKAVCSLSFAESSSNAQRQLLILMQLYSFGTLFCLQRQTRVSWASVGLRLFPQRSGGRRTRVVAALVEGSRHALVQLHRATSELGRPRSPRRGWHQTGDAWSNASLHYLRPWGSRGRASRDRLCRVPLWCVSAATVLPAGPLSLWPSRGPERGSAAVRNGARASARVARATPALSVSRLAARVSVGQQVVEDAAPAPSSKLKTTRQPLCCWEAVGTADRRCTQRQSKCFWRDAVSDKWVLWWPDLKADGCFLETLSKELLGLLPHPLMLSCDLRRRLIYILHLTLLLTEGVE